MATPAKRLPIGTQPEPRIVGASHRRDMVHQLRSLATVRAVRMHGQPRRRDPSPFRAVAASSRRPSPMLMASTGPLDPRTPRIGARHQHRHYASPSGPNRRPALRPMVTRSRGCIGSPSLTTSGSRAPGSDAIITPLRSPRKCRASASNLRHSGDLRVCSRSSSHRSRSRWSSACAASRAMRRPLRSNSTEACSCAT